MTQEENARFDQLLRAMASGERPKGGKESEGPAVAKYRADREDRKRPTE